MFNFDTLLNIPIVYPKWEKYDHVINFCILAKPK